MVRITKGCKRAEKQTEKFWGNSFWIAELKWELENLWLCCLYRAVRLNYNRSSFQLTVSSHLFFSFSMMSFFFHSGTPSHLACSARSASTTCCEREALKAN